MSDRQLPARGAPMTSQRVLVLDAQTNQALACVRSLGRAGHAVVVASHRRRPLSAWSRYCADRFRVAAESPSAFAALRAWAEARGVSVVLPVTERSCLLLNAERARWEAAGIRVACGPPEMLTRAFDKARTLELAAQCGVRTPPTRFPASLAEFREAAAEIGYPCVLKSRFSNAWVDGRFLSDPGTTYVRDPAELDAAVLARRQGPHWPILQGFVLGRGAGVFAVAQGGHPLAWFAHERLRDVRPTGSGSSLRRAVPLEPRLREPAERLLAALQWSGPAMIEFRDDGGTSPYLMEVNGRFWGSLELAVRAGVDFPSLWVAAVSDAPLDVPPPYRAGTTVRWLWGDIKRLLHILAGRPAGYPGAFPTRWQGVRELFARQPPGTELEAWRDDDRWPAVGEWVQGLGELLGLAHGPATDRAAAPGGADQTTVAEPQSARELTG